ncbi:MAG: anhydro-N-acetylmuramic acid kinase [Gammaproteobacteria bacterium]|nr:anhydro-N-acetylmuramic acid kinase [Gammaproteobacteria bacterium]MDH5776814.1 anhydro-N-acetylmuramic acid kinase [Gammaproteobacteria bacterium]
MTDKYIGLISGTSMDAIDAVLVDFATGKPELIASYSHPLTDLICEELTVLHRPGNNEIEQMAMLDVQLGRLFAQASLNLISQANCEPKDIVAIGSHGQTIRHMPDSDYPTTLQIGDPNIIAEQTGITTIADFRRRDMAAGGQGAPLVPAFHAQVFQHATKERVIINLGGIANITVLPADTSKPVTGFDTGPANGLMDTWISKHTASSFDQDGQWAASGKVQNELLTQMLADNYFDLPAPKSTGKEYFNASWLERYDLTQFKPEDVQSTLCELTVESVYQAIQSHSQDAEEIFLCGGGAHNSELCQRLQKRFSPISVSSTTEAGIDPDWVEAMCFAWLARQTMQQLPGNLPSVTGANREVILGGIYWGSKSLN